jgi:MFS family permease
VLPEFPLGQRATATALWGASGAVAAAIGPSLGGALVDWQSWRWVFYVNLVVGVPALAAARRLLTESRDERAGFPDPFGVLLLAATVGSLSIAIVEGPSWGWGSGRVVAAFVLAAALAPLFLYRSARHPAPVFELSLFRVRSFTVASAAGFIFAAGFFTVLLNGVLFLTGVWHYSILRAGVALSPGPIMAALSAPFGGRLSDRFGQRIVAAPGGLLFAAGVLFLFLSVGAEPAYTSAYLPGMLMTGIGVGLCYSGLGSAAVAELPRERFATGSAINLTLRQIGAVVGIAILFAILGGSRAAGSLQTFRHAWLFAIITGFATGVTALALGRVRARDVELAHEPGKREGGVLVKPLPSAAARQ